MQHRNKLQQNSEKVTRRLAPKIYITKQIYITTEYVSSQNCCLGNDGVNLDEDGFCAYNVNSWGCFIPNQTSIYAESLHLLH